MTTEEILAKEGIKVYEQDIRLMSKKALIENFSAVSSGEPKAALIIKNQIWQTYTWIQAGKEDLIEGNIRSYWYSHIKSTLARVNLLSGYDHSETMDDVFGEMKRYRLFRYADFGFDDDNWENRRTATNMFQVILFAEKTGWFRTLKSFCDQYGMTIAALGGTPSLLSTEYLVKQLNEVTSLNQKFYLISAVDYDPSGWIIAHSFADQLKGEGIQDYELIDIISLKNYTPQEIELYKFPIPSKETTKIEKWLETTGGINGEAYGLEADTMPRDRYKSLVKDTLESLGFI